MWTQSCLQIALATCQFLKDKVFFCFRITDVLGRISEDLKKKLKKSGKSLNDASPRLIKIHLTLG